MPPALSFITALALCPALCFNTPVPRQKCGAMAELRRRKHEELEREAAARRNQEKREEREGVY